MRIISIMRKTQHHLSLVFWVPLAWSSFWKLSTKPFKSSDPFSIIRSLLATSGRKNWRRPTFGAGSTVKLPSSIKTLFRVLEYVREAKEWAAHQNLPTFSLKTALIDSTENEKMFWLLKRPSAFLVDMCRGHTNSSSTTSLNSGLLAMTSSLICGWSALIGKRIMGMKLLWRDKKYLSHTKSFAE